MTTMYINSIYALTIIHLTYQKLFNIFTISSDPIVWESAYIHLIQAYAIMGQRLLVCLSK
jgi:hypothetical protein